MMILSWLFFFHRKMRPMKEKRSARIALRRNGRMSLTQAENPVEQDSFLRKLFRKESLVFLAKEQIPVQEADNDDTAEDITDGGRDQIVEDKGSDI